MMTPILGASGLGRCGRSTQASTLDLSSSSSSSRRHSSSSQTRKSSHTSSLMDEWSDAFTGIVDLDRRMRQLAMSEQGLQPLDSSTQLDIYEPYSPLSPSRLESLQHAHSRRKSSTDARSGSISQPSLTTGRSFPSFTSHPTNTTASSSSTTATSRFSQDSRAHSSSLLAKRRSSATSTIDSFDSTHSPIRLAPLPASPSAFGNYRLIDGTSLPRTRLMVPATCWSSLDEQDPLTPLAIPSSQLDPITPTTAAAATWTDPTAPSYFPAGLSDLSNKKKPRLLRKKAARPPLPSLVSAQVFSSPTAESGLVGDDRDRLQEAVTLPADMGKDESGRAYALRRSAQSLALSFRFKMLRAKRKVKRSGQGAADLFAAAGSQTSLGEATGISI